MHTRLLRFLATTLLLCGLGLLVSASVGAAPPPPKFWSPARCQRVMLARPLAPPRQVLCVGIGGPSFCRWTSGHRARLYSEFRVFTRYRQTNVRGVGLEPGVVRSFMLATRARPGFTRVVSHWGDQYQGWPADFFRATAGYSQPMQLLDAFAPSSPRSRPALRNRRKRPAARAGS
jgi:hypothetical protein